MNVKMLIGYILITPFASLIVYGIAYTYYRVLTEGLSIMGALLITTTLAMFGFILLEKEQKRREDS